LGHYLQIFAFTNKLLLRRPTNITVLIPHLILLELPNLKCLILSHWVTLMYVAFYFILYFTFYFFIFLESSRKATKYNKPVWWWWWWKIKIEQYLYMQNNTDICTIWYLVSLRTSHLFCCPDPVQILIQFTVPISWRNFAENLTIRNGQRYHQIWGMGHGAQATESGLKRIERFKLPSITVISTVGEEFFFILQNISFLFSFNREYHRSSRKLYLEWQQTMWTWRKNK